MFSVPIKGAIEQRLDWARVSSGELVQLVRMAVDTLTTEELRENWNMHLNDEDSSTMLEAVEEKGFTMPTTREELDEMLQSKHTP